MEEDYAKGYEKLYSNHWWWRAREAEVLRVIRKYFSCRSDLSILDIGCGNGLFFDRLREFGVPEGVEPDPKLVTDEGRARGMITVAPFNESFLPAKRYDLILMLDVIEHVDTPAAFVKHAASLLKDDGRMIITVPAFNLLWTAHDDFNLHRTRYTTGSLGGLLGGLSLRTLELRYLFRWLFVPKLLVRLKELLSVSAPKPAAVPSSLLNLVALLVSRIDLTTLRGAPLPFGTSVLAVAGRHQSARGFC